MPEVSTIEYQGRGASKPASLKRASAGPDRYTAKRLIAAKAALGARNAPKIGLPRATRVTAQNPQTNAVKEPMLAAYCGHGAPAVATNHSATGVYQWESVGTATIKPAPAKRWRMEAPAIVRVATK